MKDTLHYEENHIKWKAEDPTCESNQLHQRIKMFNKKKGGDILICVKHKNLQWMPRRSSNIDATTTGLKSMQIK